MIKAVIFDLDGTLYLGKTPVKGAAEKIAELRGRGIKILFLTNAATRSRANVALRLAGMGFGASKGETYCGAYALAKYIAEKHRGKKVYVVGEKGEHDEFAELGIQTSDEADIVAVGLDRAFSYDKLCRAHLNISKGAVFLASNYDHTYPTEIGPLPGAGSIVTAIEFASGKKAHVVGKPNPFFMELILREHHLKKDEVIMVGDRLDTDIMFAKNCGIKSALVLSGSAKKSDIKDVRPDIVIDDVTALEI
ncbi:MAG TPA: HAD-IIA family hydrolase [Candidatus Bilamarchaeum sp.]|nr:HAD-IIA family hydrolase [Candidatus Bilamarchaeum sp.]